MFRKGLGLTEVLVAMFLMSMISLGLYSLLTRSNTHRMTAEARSEAQKQAGLVISIIQADLAQAKQGSFKRVGSDIRFKVNKPGSSSGDEIDLVYQFSPPVLKRSIGGKIWRVSDNLETLSLTPVPGATGQLILDLKTEVIFPGMTESETHSQRQMMVMREDMASTRDPYWRDMGDMDKFFQTQGNLMAGLEEDANMIVQDFSSILDSIATDIESATTGQLKRTRNSLIDGLKRAQQQLADLDTQILNLDPEAIFDMGNSAGSRIWGGVSGRTRRLRDRSRQMRQALAEMKTAGTLNWARIQSIAGSDRSRMRPTMRSMFEGKEALFKAGGQIVDAMKGLNLTADVGDGVDINIFSL